MMGDFGWMAGIALIIIASAFACRMCTAGDAYIICIRNHTPAECRGPNP